MCIRTNWLHLTWALRTHSLTLFHLLPTVMKVFWNLTVCYNIIWSYSSLYILIEILDGVTKYKYMLIYIIYLLINNSIIYLLIPLYVYLYGFKTIFRKNATTFVLIGLKSWNLVLTHFWQVSICTTLTFSDHMINYTSMVKVRIVEKFRKTLFIKCLHMKLFYTAYVWILL